MILPFSTHLNGKPTNFVQKIWECLINLEVVNSKIGVYPEKEKEYNKYLNNLSVFAFGDYKPKLHTVRKDLKERWKAGTKIDFFINVRQKDMFRFAPQLPVISTQRVFMTYAYNDIIEISVNGNYINDRKQFAINDGFDTYEDFFNYFYPIIRKSEDEVFIGKIIHWTDFRY